MGTAPRASWGEYGVVDGATTLLYYVNNDATGTYNIYVQSLAPSQAVVKGQPFTATVTMKSSGLAEVPAGVVVAATANGPPFPVPCANLTADKSVTLPKLAPKKTYGAVFEGLVFTGNAEQDGVLHLCQNWPGENVTGDSFILFYTATPAPMPYIFAKAITKKTVEYDMKAAPKSPKARAEASTKTMSISFNVQNFGSLAGGVSAALWMVPYAYNAANPWIYGFSAINGTRCNYTSPVAVSDKAIASLAPGKTATVKFSDILIPTKPGPYVAAAVFDVGCVNPWLWNSSDIYASWNVFVV
ncbi:MAG: hypothetical protein J3K34DRAFT_423535, partial [Monoraphidium minutum]